MVRTRPLPILLGAAALLAASLTLNATSAAPPLWRGASRQEAKPAPPSAETLEKGKELTERVCMACHELGPDVTAGRSAEAWKKTLEEMRVMGADGSDEDFELILDYLVHTYPAKPGR